MSETVFEAVKAILRSLNIIRLDNIQSFDIHFSELWSRIIHTYNFFALQITGKPEVVSPKKVSVAVFNHYETGYCFASCCINLLQKRDTREGSPPDRAGDKSFC